MAGSDEICFVQFLHPGGEHQPDRDSVKEWNTGDHRRKFMVTRGRCIDGGGQSCDGEILFWGEWEPESEVDREISRRISNGPYYIWRPFYVEPQSYRRLQNTDPFVLTAFLYGVCQQHTKAGPTQLRYLDKGSVILFGSCVADEFVLDTVFVARDWVDHDISNYEIRLKGRVPDAYWHVTLGPQYHSDRDNGSCGSEPQRSYRLYIGATHDDPFEGMFSFFPCRLRGEAPDGFARPVIRDPRFITDNHRQGKRLNSQSTLNESRRLWDTVVSQVLRQANQLGVYAEMPEQRASHGNTLR